MGQLQTGGYLQLALRRKLNIIRIERGDRGETSPIRGVCVDVQYDV